MSLSAYLPRLWVDKDVVSMGVFPFQINGVIQHMILVKKHMLDSSSRLTPYSINRISSVGHNRCLAK